MVVTGRITDSRSAKWLMSRLACEEVLIFDVAFGVHFEVEILLWDVREIGVGKHFETLQVEAIAVEWVLVKRRSVVEILEILGIIRAVVHLRQRQLPKMAATSITLAQVVEVISRLQRLCMRVAKVNRGVAIVFASSLWKLIDSPSATPIGRHDLLAKTLPQDSSCSARHRKSRIRAMKMR